MRLVSASDDSPSSVIERARLAIDPLRAMSAFRTIEEFRRWSDARPGRVMRSTTVKVATTDIVGMAEVGLYEDGQLVAECIAPDWFDALAQALQIVRAA